MPAKEATGYSIIVPTYNRSSLLARAIESILILDRVPGWDIELIVIDNNSADDTRIVVERFQGQSNVEVRYVLETQQGLNHCRNRGITEASYGHLVYLDDDMRIDPEWLVGYSGVWKRWKPDAVVGPVIPDYEIPPPPWVGARALSSVSSVYSMKGDEEKLVEASVAHEFPGCNFAVLKSAAIEVGGFHPQLDRSGGSMLAGGDFEFGNRMVLAGKRVAYSPKCSIRHLVSAHKLSRVGLSSRAYGLGMTSRAMFSLRGNHWA